MSTTDQPGQGVEVVVEDPVTGDKHTFTGTTEEAAVAAAEAFFGVNEAQERDDD